MCAGWAWIVAATLSQAPDVAPALATADAAAAQGDYQTAIREYRTLLARADTPQARVLYRLASVENRAGQFTEATAHAVDAAARMRAAGLHADAADALNLAAAADINAGRYAEAIARLTDATTLSGQAEDWGRHAEQLSNLGNAYYYVGQYDDAARFYGRAASVTEAHRSAPWAARRRLVVAANQAALQQRLGRYAAALDVYRVLHESSPSMPPDELAQTLVNQGALFRRLGDPYKALDTYSRARELFAAAHNPSGELAVLTNTGIALALDLGRSADARAVFDTALTAATAAGASRERLLAQLYRGETAARAGDLHAAEIDFDASVAAAATLDAKEETWKALYGMGRVQRDSARPAEARAAFDRAIAVIEGLRETLGVPTSRLEFFQDKREVYDARIALGLGTDDAATTFALIERSRARAWRERVALDDVSLSAVQRHLPTETTLLAYWLGRDEGAVVRVTRDAATVHRVTPARSDLDALTRALRDPESDRWQTPAEALGEALFPPGVLDGARHVVVVPDGPLGAVPFEALAVGGRPLVERVAVRYVPTAALLSTRAPAGDRYLAPWSYHLAAFGNPVSGADTWAESADGPRLPASEAEVRAIAASLGGTARVFVGAESSKRALNAALRGTPTILHLATHGVADLAASERSRLLFSPESAGAPADSLFLREVYGLPLSGVALAVMSACDTERGLDIRGEGVQGFSRALLAAGAARTVTTLWRVADGPTAELMRVFYHHVQAGAPVDEALAAAKRALLASRTMTHPHYWAAFVLTGRGDTIPRALRWRDVGAGAAVATVALAWSWVAWRRRRRV